MGLGAATSFRWLFGSLWPLGSACAYRNGPAAASTRFGRLFVLASARPGRRPPGRPNRAPAALRSVPALGPACASRRPSVRYYDVSAGLKARLQSSTGNRNPRFIQAGALLPDLSPGSPSARLTPVPHFYSGVISKGVSAYNMD